MSEVTRCPSCGTTFRVDLDQLAAHGGKARCGRCATVFEAVACLVNRSPPSVDLLGGEALADGTPSPAFLAPPRDRPRFRVMWTLLALLALAVMALQVVYRYRTEIGVLFPATRPHLLVACMALGCDLRFPRRPDLLGIESSDLQADLKRENVLRLTALLRNRASFVQEPPLLELTLTDEQDSPVVRRVLHPVDYLGARRAAEVMTQGIAAGAEVAVVLHFDSSQIRATGYRLYLFQP